MSNEKNVPELESLSQFIFEAPLYAAYYLGDRIDRASELYGRKALTVDGHCTGCGRDATFEVHGAHCPGGDPWEKIRSRHAFDEMYITCARTEYHKVRCWFLINKMIVIKIGQFPSLADIANDEVKIYRKLLSNELASEFHKAIGLAAHGVGVGSFVYLRRVFERLIENRFHEFQQAEGWDVDEFHRLRMEDKINFLKNHLPAFLVANRRIYSILSIGVHELSEADCLSYFDVMRRSIIMILEDDLKARQEREQRQAFERLIAEFQPPTTKRAKPG